MDIIAFSGSILPQKQKPFASEASSAQEAIMRQSFTGLQNSLTIVPKCQSNNGGRRRRSPQPCET